jgi:hypothetical protein
MTGDAYAVPVGPCITPLSVRFMKARIFMMDFLVCNRIKLLAE